MLVGGGGPSKRAGVRGLPLGRLEPALELEEGKRSWTVLKVGAKGDGRGGAADKGLAMLDLGGATPSMVHNVAQLASLASWEHEGEPILDSMTESGSERVVAQVAWKEGAWILLKKWLPAPDTNDLRGPLGQTPKVSPCKTEWI